MRFNFFVLLYIFTLFFITKDEVFIFLFYIYIYIYIIIDVGYHGIRIGVTPILHVDFLISLKFSSFIFFQKQIS